MKRLALLAVASVLLLAACGGGGGGGSATAQIKSNWEKFFSSKTSVSDRVALLQNGSKFTAVVTSFANNPLASNVSSSVSSVTLEGASKAKVVYSVKVAGASAREPERRGRPRERHVEGRGREPLQADLPERQHPGRLQEVVSSAA